MKHTKPLSGPELFAKKYLEELEDWLEPVLLYHCFTGEDDGYKLGWFAGLDHTLQQTMLDKAFKEWPNRLERIATENRQEKQELDKKAEQFVLIFLK